MTNLRGQRESVGIPWDQRVVLDDFDRDAEVTLAFPGTRPSPRFFPAFGVQASF